MASSLGVTTSAHSQHFYTEEIQVPTLEHFQKIIDSIEVDLSQFSNDMSYLGFDKNKIAKMAAEKLGAFRTVKLCLLGGMRGTNLGKILDKSVKVDADIKKVYDEQRIKSNGSGPNDLTMGRLMATFPEITAHYMDKNSVPKKLTESACPAALQFPAAAGLPMSHTVRLQHAEFAVKFAFLISGDRKFHVTYYKAAFNGQQLVKRLSPSVSLLCGSPTDSDSKGVDLDTMFEALAEKYDRSRFVFQEPQGRGVSSGVGGVPIS